MTSRIDDTRCKGVNKQGNPCRAAATASGLCFFHANPGKASELGRKGGRSNSRQAAGEPAEPMILFSNDPIGVSDALGKIVSDVLAGKISPRIANTVAPLMRLQLLAFDAVDEMDKRVHTRPYYGWTRAVRKRKNPSSEEPDASAVSAETSGAGPPESPRTMPVEISNMGKSEISNVGKSEISNEATPEISTLRKSEVSNGGRQETAAASDSEISEVKKSEITNGGWEVMTKLGEPEISSEEESKISSVAKATISREGKAEVLSAGSADPQIRNYQVLPTEESLALKRERERARERELSIEFAMASSLSDGFGLDES